VIRRTLFAVTTEKGRFSIADAKLLVDEMSLKMVATDGHRLSYASFPFFNQTSQKIDLLVPKKTFGQLEELLDREIRRNSESTAEISTEDFRALLSCVTLTSETKDYTVAMTIKPGKLLLKSGSSEAETQEEMMLLLTGEIGKILIS
jgi:DNA polymerase-3 subunit beta